MAPEENAPEEKALTDEEILELFKAADPAAKNAAIGALKGETPQGGDMMSMFAGMMGGKGGENKEASESEENPSAEDTTE